MELLPVPLSNLSISSNSDNGNYFLINSSTSILEHYNIQKNKWIKFGRFRAVRKVFLKTVLNSPTTTSDYNLIFRWSDYLSDYDYKDFDMFKDYYEKHNKITIMEIDQVLADLQTVVHYNPKEIKDFTQGELNCMLIQFLFFFVFITLIWAILIESQYYWLVLWNFVSGSIFIYWMIWFKKRAFNKLKVRKDTIYEKLKVWNKKFKRNGVKFCVGTYGAWLELFQIDKQTFNVLSETTTH